MVGVVKHRSIAISEEDWVNDFYDQHVWFICSLRDHLGATEVQLDLQRPHFEIGYIPRDPIEVLFLLRVADLEQFLGLLGRLHSDGE